MSTNLINKNNGYTFGYIYKKGGSIHHEINQNQDFFMNEYFLVKKGEIVEFTSKHKYGVTETSIYNAVYIHVYDMQKQWKFALIEEATELNKDLSLKYEVTEDCYIRFNSRGFYDFEHKAAINIINDTIPRLEKFIYAICSMDVSDLPVPLSRIEKLWNCLITGETPDFEPLSRNEKYLMAMLDRYDISNLPAPMSRGEKLLYKIAVGETDLSDVPGYLSRYEELLKYLIENGGISEGDFEYVLYTLNQSLSTLYTTAEKPVKSAILKGNTLVNIANYELSTSSSEISCSQNFSLQKNNTAYTLFNFTDKIITFNTYTTTTSSWRGFENVGANSKKLLTLKDFTIKEVIGRAANGWDKTTETEKFLNGYMIIEGDYTNVDIPYFEGMQSVKMPVLTTTGKNLFHSDIQVFNDSNYIRTGNNIDNVCDTELKPSTTYTLSWNGNSMDGQIRLYNNGIKTNSIDIGWYKSSVTFTTSEVENGFSFYTKLSEDSSLTSDMSFNVQLEEGLTATTYEPYNSITLSTPSDLELRGVGDVQDTLDCLTGEKIEYVGEFILDGNSDIEYEPDNGDFYTQLNTLAKISGDYSYHIVSDKGKVLYYHTYVRDYEGTDLVISGYHDWGYEGWEYPGENWLYFAKKDIASESDMKAWLAQNPVTIYYELAKPTTKSIDISTVDQDNQPTQLGTFENVTHVSLVAENLIPEVEMEVATHISEELVSASPLMDDILTKQEQLSTTIDEQSENVDATMIATTEIFEEIL